MVVRKKISTAGDMGGRGGTAAVVRVAVRGCWADTTSMAHQVGAGRAVQHVDNAAATPRCWGHRDVRALPDRPPTRRLLEPHAQIESWHDMRVEVEFPASRANVFSESGEVEQKLGGPGDLLGDGRLEPDPHGEHE
jgi:hypothetical protein